jgi:hypothetical protein
LTAKIKNLKSPGAFAWQLEKIAKVVGMRNPLRATRTSRKSLISTIVSDNSASAAKL